MAYDDKLLEDVFPEKKPLKEQGNELINYFKNIFTIKNKPFEKILFDGVLVGGIITFIILGFMGVSAEELGRRSVYWIAFLLGIHLVTKFKIIKDKKPNASS